MWKDIFNIYCESPVCGSLKYDFVDAGTLSTLFFSPALTVIDDGAGSITFTVQTTNYSYLGTYTVKIYATMRNDVTWTGTRPSSSWGNFKVFIVDPCNPILCKYTTMQAETAVQTDMTILVNGV
jgi:hypothetical protein